MAIAPTELLWYRAAADSDTDDTANGGRVDFSNQSIDGASNNLFPNTTEQQRTDGIVQWRKAFIGVRNTDNLTLIDPRISLESGTPGDSVALIYPGTQDDTEDEISGRPYGYASLAADAAFGATEITVTTEADWSAELAADQPFQVGDSLRVDDRATVADSGQVDYVEIDSVSYTGTALTIGLTSGLTHAFTAADGVHVASVYRPGDQAASYGTLTVSNETGSTLDYDPAGGNLSVPNVGAVRQVWTITITDAASGALSLSGDTLGTVATGALGSNLQPNNPAGGRYFSLLTSGWSGTAVDGDTLTFATAPNAIPLWYKRAVPAGAASIASDPITVCIEAESA